LCAHTSTLFNFQLTIVARLRPVDFPKDYFGTSRRVKLSIWMKLSFCDAARSAPEALVVALAVRAGWSDEPDNDQDLRSRQRDDMCVCDSLVTKNPKS
jgi:hypothetical protein